LRQAAASGSGAPADLRFSKPTAPAPALSPLAASRPPIAINPNPIVATPVASPAPRIPAATTPILVSETLNMQDLAAKDASPSLGVKLAQ